MRQVFFIIVCSLLSVACYQSEQLRQFENIWVSDPRIVDSRLSVAIVNKTGQDLCYFNDGLFFGFNAIEGSSGRTQILRPTTGNSSLETIKFGGTGRTDFKLVKLPRGKGEISIALSDHSFPNSGDDLSFSIIFCEPEADGLHRSLVYSSRLT